MRKLRSCAPWVVGDVHGQLEHLARTLTQASEPPRSLIGVRLYPPETERRHRAAQESAQKARGTLAAKHAVAQIELLRSRSNRLPANVGRRTWLSSGKRSGQRLLQPTRNLANHVRNLLQLLAQALRTLPQLEHDRDVEADSHGTPTASHAAHPQPVII
jgi:hypothetical protein